SCSLFPDRWLLPLPLIAASGSGAVHRIGRGRGRGLGRGRQPLIAALASRAVPGTFSSDEK
ncbi:MAG: hypothetical protein AB1Z65_04565, partial [Candidatus Sulfomarinibacteraceae bacterium]